ncbi:hypothetical protein SUBVAR_04086 [Subdoligranulum variabile DSM 15176]|uniref:Uncharacterized protein n=1 Tax=Subdoligranulum variabile DSM 15176 TaxID=411471 RepID=D1PIC1_9FIRM|nr:hypothetical protein SUBVAR_04086 [Subdoligranulum variabile DSM 15176]
MYLPWNPLVPLNTGKLSHCHSLILCFLLVRKGAPVKWPGRLCIFCARGGDLVTSWSHLAV